MVQREVPRGIAPTAGFQKFRKLKRRPPDWLTSCSGFLGREACR